MDRVAVSPSDRIEGMGAHVTIRSTRGAWDLNVPFPKGEPEVPLGWDEVEAKFRSLAGTVLDQARVDQIATQVRDLEKLPKVSQLATLLRP